MEGSSWLSAGSLVQPRATPGFPTGSLALAGPSSLAPHVQALTVEHSPFMGLLWLGCFVHLHLEHVVEH